VVENALQGIAIHQGDRLCYVNAALVQMFGYARPEDLLGRDAFETLVAPEERAVLRSRAQALYRGEGQPPHPGWRGLHRAGADLWVSTAASRITWQGRPAILALYANITELRQAEEASRRLNAELEQRVRDRTAELEAANKELEAFSFSVSHDLRAPLRAIDGFSCLLLEKYTAGLTAEAREFLNLVRANTRQMSQLIDDLLAFSRLSRQSVKKQPVEPAQIVRQCLDALRHEQEGRQVEINLGTLPTCRAEPTLLKQVLINLLSNALKYTRKRETARIEVGWSTSRGGPAYFVRDNGVGFDMRYAHKLFGVFQRLHRAEDYEGTGVGLAIVQRIIHRHGGQVWAEAQPDQGAVFYFTLGEGAP
jgi:PAS domain S-box-containing protein